MIKFLDVGFILFSGLFSIYKFIFLLSVSVSCILFCWFFDNWDNFLVIGILNNFNMCLVCFWLKLLKKFLYIFIIFKIVWFILSVLCFGKYVIFDLFFIFNLCFLNMIWLFVGLMRLLMSLIIVVFLLLFGFSKLIIWFFLILNDVLFKMSKLLYVLVR